VIRPGVIVKYGTLYSTEEEKESIKQFFDPSLLHVSFIEFQQEDPLKDMKREANGSTDITFVFWKCGSRVDELVSNSQSITSTTNGNCVFVLCIPKEEWAKWQGVAQWELQQLVTFRSGLAASEKEFLVLAYDHNPITNRVHITDKVGDCSQRILDFVQRAAKKG